MVRVHEIGDSLVNILDVAVSFVWYCPCYGRLGDGYWTLGITAVRQLLEINVVAVDVLEGVFELRHIGFWFFGVTPRFQNLFGTRVRLIGAGKKLFSLKKYFLHSNRYFPNRKFIRFYFVVFIK